MKNKQDETNKAPTSANAGDEAPYKQLYRVVCESRDILANKLKEAIEWIEASKAAEKFVQSNNAPGSGWLPLKENDNIDGCYGRSFGYWYDNQWFTSAIRLTGSTHYIDMPPPDKPIKSSGE